MGEKRNAYKILMGKHLGKISLGKSKISCRMVGFGISGIDPLGLAIKVLLG
jgi:hypothetical protein